MGRSYNRLSTIHIDGAVSTLQEQQRSTVHGVRYSWRGHDLLLGQCSLVDGKPVHVGQTSRPLRGVHYFTRSNIGNPSRHVTWWCAVDRALRRIGSIDSWALFNPPISPAWPAVLVVFTLTLASLYALGMALSSLYLVYGREADSIKEALHEPVSFLSGVYFPQQMLQFPAAVQIAASLIPLTIGMDALRRTLFSGEGLQQISFHIGVLALMAGVLLVLSQRMLKFLEERGRKAGTISVRIR